MYCKKCSKSYALVKYTVLRLISKNLSKRSSKDGQKDIKEEY